MDPYIRHKTNCPLRVAIALGVIGIALAVYRLGANSAAAIDTA